MYVVTKYQRGMKERTNKRQTEKATKSVSDRIP